MPLMQSQPRGEAELAIRRPENAIARHPPRQSRISVIDVVDGRPGADLPGVLAKHRPDPDPCVRAFRWQRNGSGSGEGNGNGANHGDESSPAHVSSGERGKLICLTTYARKAHFHYHQESRVYVLALLKEIPEFVRTVLPIWKRYFSKDA